MSKNVLAELVTKMTIESSQFKKELEKTTARTTAWSNAQKKAANDGVYANDRLAKSYDKVNAAGNRFKTGALANVGYQLQDMAVQAQMGTNALVIMGQQIPQLLGGFGAMGAIAGTFVAIGATAASVMAPKLMESKNAVDDLNESMERLRKTALKNDDGIYEFTESIRELSNIGANVVGAELEASLIRAENAAKASARSIADSMKELGAGYGFSDITDYIEGLNKDLTFSISYTDGFKQTAKELGEEFGKSGVEANKLGSEIIYALAELQRAPDSSKFETLQKRLADLATAGEGVSDAAKLMVSDLALFFAEARSASETAAFLDEQLKRLGDTGKVDITPNFAGMNEAQDLVVQLSQEMLIAEANLAGNTLEAQKLAAAFQIGKNSIEELPEAAQRLLERLHQINEQQKAAQEEINSQASSSAALKGIDTYLDNQNDKVSAAYERRVSIIENLNLSEEELKSRGYETLLDLQSDYLAALNDQYSVELDIEQAKADRISEIKRAAEERDAQMRIASEQMILKSVMSSASQLTSAIMSASNEQSGLYQAAFLAQQGLAIATTIMNTEMAAISALAPPPVGLGPLAGAAYVPWIKGLGYTSAALIGAQTIAGAREYGGPVETGRSYLVGEKGPELFTPRYSGDITSNKKLSSKGNKSSSGDTYNNFTIQAVDSKSFESFIKNKGGILAKEIERSERR